MNAFYDGQYDVLLSTTIVESGLDIPTANTLIVHRADMFGLAQLYQLRGRVGRSKQRAYALFTLPANRKLTDTADRRLKVLQSLDTLGAGFQLASHDLDIRGAGNLLGEEQSGHIKEVGFELYQQMLEEAVAEVEELAKCSDGGWSPQIAIGTAVMIPEGYRARPATAAGALPPARRSANRRRKSTASAPNDRPLRVAAGGSRAPLEDRLHQGALPPRPMSKSWMPGRKASSFISASANSPIPPVWCAIFPSKGRWPRSGPTTALCSCANGRTPRSASPVRRW